MYSAMLAVLSRTSVWWQNSLSMLRCTDAHDGAVDLANQGLLSKDLPIYPDLWPRRNVDSQIAF